MTADSGRHGALDIRELLANIIFWLRGDLGYKFGIFFELFGTINYTNPHLQELSNEKRFSYIQTENLVKVVTDALTVFKESFYLCKTTCDKMNTKLDGMISKEEFKDFCRYNPAAIDFLCRLTIGPYPPSPELQVEMLQLHMQS